MVKTGTCRTGQAAKALGLSTYQVRRLCETGLVVASLAPGGHWRIRVSEVSRLQQEGVPVIPSAAEASEEKDTEKHLPHPAPRSTHSQNFSYDPEPDLDKAWLSEQSQPRDFSEATTSHFPVAQQSTFQGGGAREEWHNRWLEWALLSVSWSVPEEYRLDVREQVDDTLQTLHPRTPESVTRTLVQSAVQKGLRPWRNAQDTKSALDTALNLLPWSARSPNWLARAREAAGSAISALADAACFETKLAAATGAVQKIVLEFDDETVRQKVIQELVFLPQLNSVEMEDAKAAIRARVESCRFGSSESEIRRARQTALEPFQKTQRQREKRRRLEQRIDHGLSHIQTFLQQLWSNEELEGFENVLEVWSYANEIRDEVGVELMRELESYEQDVSDQKIRALIEDIVDDHLRD